jgi:hypothetical protein
MPGLGIQIGLLARAGDPGYSAWLAHVMPAAACSRPIRLRVEAEWHHPSGRVLVDPVSSTMPDGVLYVACKNRRASVCPACAETYRADMYQLVKAGLVGGKGVPASIATHPCVFVTLTAPSFGSVHSAGKPGQRRLCRPRRSAETCPHGIELACWAVHDRDDSGVGEPLCRDCYAYQHQAVWNIHAGELWRRTSIALTRAMTRLARARGVQVRLSYAKVAEYQHRGVVHFHALIRLDGRDLTEPSANLPPHPSVTVAHLEAAIVEAVAGTSFVTAGHPRRREGWSIGWGERLDIRRVQLAAADLADDGQITTTAVAAYLAKYATKATEDTGHTSGRLTEPSVLLLGDRGDSHQLRQLQACWYLGQPPLSCTTAGQRQAWADTWGRLQRWAHMLGYGGHFATKSRRYSVTLTALRAVRKAYQRGEQPPPPGAVPARNEDAGADSQITVIHALAGIGWHTTADAMLANTAAAKARERRRIAREELTTV